MRLADLATQCSRPRVPLGPPLGVLCLAILLALAAPGLASAKDRQDPGVLKAVLDCRPIKDDAARLACYDAATTRMGEAEARGDILVIDKETAKAAHREAFGLPLPSLDFVTRALKPEEVDRLEGVVRAVRPDANERWTLELEGGAVWRQIDGHLDRAPHVGSKVSIRRGMLGSFLLNVDGQPAVKAHRDR